MVLPAMIGKLIIARTLLSMSTTLPTVTLGHANSVWGLKHLAAEWNSITVNRIRQWLKKKKKNGPFQSFLPNPEQHNASYVVETWS